MSDSHMWPTSPYVKLCAQKRVQEEPRGCSLICTVLQHHCQDAGQCKAAVRLDELARAELPTKPLGWYVAATAKVRVKLSFLVNLHGDRLPNRGAQCVKDQVRIILSIVLRSKSEGSGCQSLQNDSTSFMPVGLHQILPLRRVKSFTLSSTNYYKNNALLTSSL